MATMMAAPANRTSREQNKSEVPCMNAHQIVVTSLTNYKTLVQQFVPCVVVLFAVHARLLLSYAASFATR